MPRQPNTVPRPVGAMLLGPGRRLSCSPLCVAHVEVQLWTPSVVAPSPRDRQSLAGSEGPRPRSSGQGDRHVARYSRLPGRKSCSAARPPARSHQPDQVHGPSRRFGPWGPRYTTKASVALVSPLRCPLSLVLLRSGGFSGLPSGVISRGFADLLTVGDISFGALCHVESTHHNLTCLSPSLPLLQLH